MEDFEIPTFEENDMIPKATCIQDEMQEAFFFRKTDGLEEIRTPDLRRVRATS